MSLQLAVKPQVEDRPAISPKARELREAAHDLVDLTTQFRDRQTRLDRLNEAVAAALKATRERHTGEVVTDAVFAEVARIFRQTASDPSVVRHIDYACAAVERLLTGGTPESERVWAAAKANRRSSWSSPFDAMPSVERSPSSYYLPPTRAALAEAPAEDYADVTW